MNAVEGLDKFPKRMGRAAAQGRIAIPQPAATGLQWPDILAIIPAT